MRKITQVAAVLALVAIPAACANSDAGTGSSPTGLVFVSPSANPTIVGTVALGVATGTFTEAGVDVDVTIGDGAQSVNAMVARQADLTETSATNAGSLEAQGKDVSAIWASSGGGLGLILYTAADGPPTIAEFRARNAGDCVLGVTAPGSSGYGYATIFNKALGFDCKLLELGDTAQIVGAVLAGRVDLMISGMSDPSVRTAVKAGQLHELLRSTDPQIHELGIPQFPERVLVGLQDTLHDKHESVERFVTGMKKAAELYASMPSEEIADKLLTVDAIKNEYPAPEDRHVLIDGITDSKPFVNWTGGRISPQDWQLGLDTVAGWGVKDFEPTDPARSYDRVVDMSFYEGAQP